MVTFKQDAEVDRIDLSDGAQALGVLLGLMKGRPISYVELAAEPKELISKVLERVLSAGPKSVRLRYQEFNELLLLFGFERVEWPFFQFFFGGDRKGPLRENEFDSTTAVSFSDLAAGVKKVRGFALLCFGSFRFAYRMLSRAKTVREFNALLHPWNLNTAIERRKYRSRGRALLAKDEKNNVIPRKDTWLLGYLSSGALESDLIYLDSEKSASQEMKDMVRVQEAQLQAEAIGRRQTDARRLGRLNSIKYLTWDCLDVYVATSMRAQWEFEETFEHVAEVFNKHLADLSDLRWFDPTQSYEEGTVDKGLIEALMLRRAKCTIYMAQDGDTLGKDSELAATLAQGKPVIAFVRKITDAQLKNYVSEIARRPLRYVYQRVLTLLADGFFDKSDNLDLVEEKLSIIDPNLNIIIEKEVINTINRLSEHYSNKLFLIVGDEDKQFLALNKHPLELAYKLVAASDAVASDSRAATISTRHPLAMQVHLNSGVSNGILVARDAKTCASLVRSVLLSDLEFDIAQFDKSGKRPSSFGDEQGDPILGIGLYERSTGSKFRVVTKNESLTNSFWNFYRRES